MDDRVVKVKVKKEKKQNTAAQQRAGSVIMGNALMQHRLAIAGLLCSRSTELVNSRMVPSVWLIGHFWSWMIFW